MVRLIFAIKVPNKSIEVHELDFPIFIGEITGNAALQIRWWLHREPVYKLLLLLPPTPVPSENKYRVYCNETFFFLLCTHQMMWRWWCWWAIFTIDDDVSAQLEIFTIFRVLSLNANGFREWKSIDLAQPMEPSRSSTPIVSCRNAIQQAR